jgi:hypothetical protein
VVRPCRELLDRIAARGADVTPAVSLHPPPTPARRQRPTRHPRSICLPPVPTAPPARDALPDARVTPSDICLTLAVSDTPTPWPPGSAQSLPPRVRPLSRQAPPGATALFFMATPSLSRPLSHFSPPHPPQVSLLSLARAANALTPPYSGASPVVPRSEFVSTFVSDNLQLDKDYVAWTQVRGRSGGGARRRDRVVGEGSTEGTQP